MGENGSHRHQERRSTADSRPTNHTRDMRVSSSTGKSKRIKTHQYNFHTRIHRNMQCHTRDPRTRSGSRNETTDSRGTYQVYPGTNLSFKPLLALHKVVIQSQSMMRSPRGSIEPRPPRYYSPIQVDPLSRV
ncbi:hypothetical protein M9H77_30567 [Catharanthus roseus]|uniref:Uncharacterized protein n=1 Tax=Catharanthus roseus TaxID=4058 RepID=A0ACB9ZXL1_CATRO|nr:hypothetical protein M9H77_30567 [Catharanthus roseus]